MYLHKNLLFLLYSVDLHLKGIRKIVWKNINVVPPQMEYTRFPLQSISATSVQKRLEQCLLYVGG